MATKCVCAYSMVKSACTGTVLESVSFVGSSLETSGELADMSVSICLRLYQAAIRAATSCFCSVDSLSHNMFPLALTEQQSCYLCSSTVLLCSIAAHHVALSVLILAVPLLAPSGLVAGEPWSVCGDSGEYDDKSQYLAKLNLVAAALPKNASASPNLFATGEAGAVPEKVTALALCRGDANSRACSSCLANAFANLPNVCPGSKEAVIYYDACMLRYSDIQFLSADDSGPLGVELTYTVRNDANATSEPARYQRAVATLMNATADYAAYNSTRRYATGQADLDREFPKVYSWAQCTPDLTPGLPRSVDRAVAGAVHRQYRGQASWSPMQLRVRDQALHQWPRDGAAASNVAELWSAHASCIGDSRGV
ncbi:cysteine-rich receptor-like protein kinase 6 [Aegilops tauschii subsp. strangulata]|uniref:cysteine-rich receptor-like protein kinase 6 n=1 Tax=Aegilops tauschii subsp. strangulata TaxID=200361 RepID=UPI003CC84518